MPIVYLVGAKADIPEGERKVDRNEAEALASELEASYYEVSAKNNGIDRKIDDMFEDLSVAIRYTFNN